ncbi:MAG: glycosyltransferase [Gammaproteobacteria bacterium]|nr:glycosyltransferase [Gammaproteobacteria bacterium]
MSGVTVVTTSFAREIGGQQAAGSFVEDFCSAVNRHLPVSIVAPGGQDEVDEFAGMPVYRYAAPERPLSQLRVMNPANWPAILRVLRNGQGAVLRAVERNRPAYIFALWALPSGQWARAASRRYGVPYGIWCLGSDIWSLGRVPVVRKVLGRVMHGAADLFADGFALADEAALLADRSCGFLASARRLEIASRTPRTEPPYRLVFIGRWHPNKGIDLLLEALRGLDDKYWTRIESIDIAGGGPLEALVRQQCGELENAGRPVRLHGYVDKAQASSMLAGADWLMIPSRIESIPVIFSDAMSAGLPVLATPVGDLPRLLQSKRAGVLAAAATGEALRHGLQQLLTDSPASYVDGVNALRSQFDIDEVAAAFCRRITGSRR